MFGFLGSETKNNSNSLLLDTPHAGSEKHVWAKPADCKFLYVMLIGGGGAGGGGAQLSAGGGGGGGGTGAITNFFLPGIFVPNFLYFRVGVGGAPNGGAGGPTFVSMIDDTTALGDPEVIAYAQGGSGGGTPTTTAGGTAGAGGVVFSSGSNASRLLQLGRFNANAGRAGFTGGTSSIDPSNGTSVTLYEHYIWGGLGGGGWNGTTARAGGGFVLTGNNVDYGTPVSGGTTTAGLRDGDSGVFDRTRNRAFMIFGGAGGGSGGSGAGGNGGNGIYGSGGGGGGAATTTRGAGGRGGSGAALIVWW